MREEKENQNKRARTEEVNDIIERIPNNFGKTLLFLSMAILLILVLFGFLIQYPDVIQGRIVISGTKAPVSLVAEFGGKLNLTVSSSAEVKKGEIIGWIDNPGNPVDVRKIKNLLYGLHLPVDNFHLAYSKFPNDIKIGDLTGPYYSLMLALKRMSDYENNKLFGKQQSALLNILSEKRNSKLFTAEKEELNKGALEIIRSTFKRDSILWKNRVISLAEFERSQMNKLNSEDQFKTYQNNSASIREEIQAAERSLRELEVANNEKRSQLSLEVLTAYNNLIEKIDLWEKQYLLISPIDGRTQMQKFWTKSHFVKPGDLIATIVPNQGQIVGLGKIPLAGAGKVEKGQTAIVKLDDYPFSQFGFLKAKVNELSIIPTTESNVAQTEDIYMVKFSLPNGLKTNLGRNFSFKYEMKGVVEIITGKRLLIERFFDRLRASKQR